MTPRPSGGGPAYVGGYQYLAVLAWASGAAVSFFALAIISPASRRRWGPVLAFGGMYLTFACLDDLFMLHESFQVDGFPEPLLVVHALAMLGFLVLIGRIWHSTPWIVLLGALMGLGRSFGLDILQNLDIGGLKTNFRGMVIEEALKLTGICLLAGYFMMVATRAIRHV